MRRGHDVQRLPDLKWPIGSITLDRLTLETDSTARSWTSDENNQPARVVEVAAKIAAMDGITPEEVGRHHGEPEGYAEA